MIYTNLLEKKMSEAGTAPTVSTSGHSSTINRGYNETLTVPTSHKDSSAASFKSFDAHFKTLNAGFLGLVKSMQTLHTKMTEHDDVAQGFADLQARVGNIEKSVLTQSKALMEVLELVRIMAAKTSTQPIPQTRHGSMTGPVVVSHATVAAIASVPKPVTSPKKTLVVEVKSEPKVEPKAEVKPEPKLEPKVEIKPEPKLEPKVEVKPEPKLEPKVEVKPEPKVEVKPEPKPEPKVEVKLEPKVEVKPELKVEVKPSPKPEMKPETKTEVKPSPKPSPKPEVKPSPKQETKPKSKPTSKQTSPKEPTKKATIADVENDDDEVDDDDNDFDDFEFEVEDENESEPESEPEPTPKKVAPKKPELKRAATTKTKK